MLTPFLGFSFLVQWAGSVVLTHGHTLELIYTAFQSRVKGIPGSSAKCSMSVGVGGQVYWYQFKPPWELRNHQPHDAQSEHGCRCSVIVIAKDAFKKYLFKIITDFSTKYSIHF